MTLRIGMLGYGFMGKAHTNALDRLPLFFPDAPSTDRHILVGRHEKSLAEAAERYDFTRITDDWEEALDEIDVLLNLGPNHLHAEPSIAALERDIHVLCEKPLASTRDDAERMAATADASNAVAGIGFNYRFVPAIRYAKRLIEAGELGEIRHFHGRYVNGFLTDETAGWSWRLSKEHAGAGALGDLGSHTIDLARYLVGDIVTVSGHTRTFTTERPFEWGDDGETREVDVDDAYSAQVDFDNGAMGVLQASRQAHGETNNNNFEVHGTDGAVKFNLARLNELEVHTGDNRGFQTVLITDDDDPYGDVWWPPGHVIGWEHTFVHEHEKFLTAIAENRAFSPDFADGAAVQRVISAIQQSDESGQRVEL
ncbi:MULTISPECIES: Gfo/Idh/MocA family oxidoreductase [unclassified Haladaptatus]|uniref:Gfo/Idh/MocA family protein n=1 Tax=unclassified Haladaptatus TaxID=2622732 RepID=UPI00209BC5C2|nr:MULTISPECIES: Gfo/Idh/MocA family oxidoreductase [unclassified Haladaptatus]MCO8245271.1 Gfo/Idh/MocA family oxidoreductase [Haladaptatus sp. AB643]MCO8256601.1 Gfo/Idh/MocA family oxidoreductase [Haladaptatus sp. AB618]